MTAAADRKIDAKRIAQFACLHHRMLKSMQLPSTCLLKLKNLMAFRDRLVKTNVSLKNAIKDLNNIAGLVDNSFIIKQSVAQHRLIEEQIKDTDKQLEVTLKEDEEVQKHFNLIKSVVGIGMITAVAFLIYTQNFTAFGTGRQFACYAGIAPFERSAAAV